MALIFLQEGDVKVGSYGTDMIAATPSFSGNFTVIGSATSSLSFNLSQSLQNNMTVEFPGASGDYNYQANLATATVDMYTSGGRMIAALPVAPDMTTPILSFSDGLKEVTVSDANGDGVYDADVVDWFEETYTEVDLKTAGDTVTAEAGVAEAFLLDFSISGGMASSANVLVTIDGFDTSEDILRFDDSAAIPATEAEFLDAAMVVANDFYHLTTISFYANSPDTGSEITLAGIADATLGIDGGNAFFEVV